jgi:hypothetical protein
MIEIDPQDRILRVAERKRPIGRVIAIISVAVLILGAGIYYWQISSNYADVYKQLNIQPLPLTVEMQPQIYSRLAQLSREPCYRDAILKLSDALLDAGYPRESATSLLAFSRRCGDTDNEAILTRAYIGFKKISDFPAALQIADQLVNSDPADAQYRYSRGATNEQLRNFSGADSATLNNNLRVARLTNCRSIRP